MEDTNADYLKWGTIARNFFKSAKLQAKLIVENDNCWIVLTDATKRPPPSSEEYDAITEASDHNIGIPVIYTFYHGLELILKGLIAREGKAIPKNHNLNTLFDKFQNLYPQESGLIAVFASHIDISKMEADNPVREFCQDNQIGTALFYQALRYPESFSGKDFMHMALKYNEGSGSKYFQSMINTIEYIMDKSEEFLN